MSRALKTRLVCAAISRTQPQRCRPPSSRNTRSCFAASCGSHRSAAAVHHVGGHPAAAASCGTPLCRVHSKPGSAVPAFSYRIAMPQIGLHSTVQAKAMLDLLQREAVVEENIATVTQLVSDCRFEPRDAQSIYDVLVTSADNPSSQRRKAQDFTTVLDYFTSLDWKILTSTDTNESTKTMAVIGRMLSLGCRCPSEPSLRCGPASSSHLSHRRSTRRKAHSPSKTS